MPYHSKFIRRATVGEGAGPAAIRTGSATSSLPSLT
jgi:hypothetical protein